MIISYKELIEKIPYKSPDDHLSRAIIVKIRQAEIIRMSIRVSIFGFLGILSTIASIPAIKYMMLDLARSGFCEYISLIVSDSSYVLNNLKLFIFSIGTSLPLVETIVLLTITLIFIYSLNQTLYYLSSLLNGHNCSLRKSL